MNRIVFRVPERELSLLYWVICFDFSQDGSPHTCIALDPPRWFPGDKRLGRAAGSRVWLQD